MMQLPDGFGEQMGDLLRQMAALCDKYEVEKGDWLSLAVKMALANGEVSLSSDKGGRPAATSVHRVRDWLKVQRKIDEGHSQSNACEISKISRSRYYAGKSDAVVKALAAAHECLGADAFWASIGDADWDGEVERIESLPRDLRLALSGQKEFSGEIPPSLLSGESQDK